MLELGPGGITTKDFMVSGEQFNIVPDATTGLYRTQPLPDNLDPYYQSDEYLSHNDRPDTLTGNLYARARAWNIRRKLSHLQSVHPTPGTLLEIGAGQGDFVVAARNSGWEVTGVEPSRIAREAARKRGVDLYEQLVEVPGANADCIALWHVLEHIPDLETTVNEIRQRLAPGGTLILALPNYRSWDARHYGSFWAGYDVPRHVWHFSRDAVEAVFTPHGFKLFATRPMWLDAFYVSWLSETYRGNALAALRGGLVGFWSNLRAMQTGEYSSLIYILQKKA